MWNAICPGGIGMLPADGAGQPGETALLPASAAPGSGDMGSASPDIIAAGREGPDRTAREAGPLDA